MAAAKSSTSTPFGTIRTGPEKWRLANSAAAFDTAIRTDRRLHTRRNSGAASVTTRARSA